MRKTIRKLKSSQTTHAACTCIVLYCIHLPLPLSLPLTHTSTHKHGQCRILQMKWRSKSWLDVDMFSTNVSR